MKILLELNETVAGKYAFLAMMEKKKKKDLYVEALTAWIESKNEVLRDGLTKKSGAVGKEETFI